MNSKLASLLAFAAVLAISTASAQTGDRVTVVPGGPSVTLVARVATLEARVAQLTSRVEALNGQMAALDGYATHRHNFNDNISGGEAAHDVTGFPHQ